MRPDLDYKNLARSYISREIVLAAGIRRVDSSEGARIVGRLPNANKDYSGLLFPYPSLTTGQIREYRLRRDFPDLERKSDGTLREIAKYLGPPDRPPLLYYPLLVRHEQFLSWVNDIRIPIIFVEGEKKALALMRITLDKRADNNPPFIPIAVPGVWGFLSRAIEKITDENGERRSVGGILNDFQLITLKSRRVVILYDSNVHWNKSVYNARKTFANKLHYDLGANVLFATMPKDCGVNGPDELAFRDGPEAVLKLLDEAQSAINLSLCQQRERSSPHERKKRADALRKLAGQNPEARAADVLGSTAAKHLARLWAEADMDSENRDLLFTLETMAQGENEIKFFYSNLYPLLYKLKGSEYERTAIGGWTLKSWARRKIRERFERLEVFQKKAGITFAYFEHGHKVEGDNVGSRVKLYTRDYIAEVMIMAEEDPGYARHKKASRERAFARFVREKQGIAYIQRPHKREGKNKQIADGWQCVKGRMEATIKRMQQRGDSDEQIWKTAIEYLPLGLVEFIRQRLL
jgi:hypothetical protein